MIQQVLVLNHLLGYLLCIEQAEEDQGKVRGSRRRGSRIAPQSLAGTFDG